MNYLSLLFPEYYGTVDQFTVKALKDIGLDSVREIKENEQTIIDVVILEEIYRSKARELNSFSGENWTPRRIDMVLWTFMEDCKR